MDQRLKTYVDLWQKQYNIVKYKKIKKIKKKQTNKTKTQNHKTQQYILAMLPQARIRAKINKWDYIKQKLLHSEVDNQQQQPKKSPL